MSDELKSYYSSKSLKQIAGMKSSDYSDSDRLIELGIGGHFPLFHQQWLTDSFSKGSRPISLAKARKNLKKSLDTLSKHRSYERKQEALWSFAEEDRNVFIQSFFRVVENRILDKDITQLQ